MHTAQRHKFPDLTRNSLTRKVMVGNCKFYVTVSFYPDTDLPGEVFVNIAKEGSTLGGMVDALAVTISIALQYGVPWHILSEKYKHTRFEPNDNVYSSLTHAIATAIDELVVQHKSMWGTVSQ